MNKTPTHQSFILDIVQSWRRELPNRDLSNFLLAICVTRLGRIIDDLTDQVFRKRFGISGSDMRVLFALRRAGKPYLRRPTDLFRALLVTSGAITKQVDRLSKIGLVERVSGDLKSGVQLTAKGLKVVNAATDILIKDSPIEPGVRTLSQADREAVHRLVEQILLGIEATAGKKKTRPRHSGAREPARFRAKQA